ncbi:preprotein translocase subunit SecE [Salinispora sp. H7-4]|uniref:preprotein translocase subunit SecE n=1 Tax=Salinispora sp. H7-4 TaxID=2748321 RepID=UPI0015D1229D|nr:preprotein translocase subunit SecE [Salinispora sp. H7-4]NYT93118.1 preprotein translocase subunit SecE [Salinispora sp. H7-4]
MADNKRRGEDADDERLDGELDAAGDAGADDESASRGEGASSSRAESGDRPKSRTQGDKVGPIGRVARFVREVVAELRKVIWPTRKELLTYASVVIVFVAVMLAIVAGLDLAFAEGVLWVFGDPS